MNALRAPKPLTNDSHLARRAPSPLSGMSNRDLIQQASERASFEARKQKTADNLAKKE